MQGVQHNHADLVSHNCLVLSGSRNWTLRGVAKQINAVKVSGNFSTNCGEVIIQAVLRCRSRAEIGFGTFATG